MTTPIRPRTFSVVIQARYDDEDFHRFAYNIEAMTKNIAVARAGQRVAKLHGVKIVDVTCVEVPKQGRVINPKIKGQ